LSAGGIEGQTVGAEGAGTAPDAAVVGGVDVAFAAVGGLEGTDAVGGVVIEREGAAGLGHLGEVAVGVVGVARHLDAVGLGVDDLDALGAGALGDGLGEAVAEAVIRPGEAPGGGSGLRGDEALEFVELVGDFFAGHPVLLANDFAVVGGGGIPVFYVNRAGFGEAGELAEGGGRSLLGSINEDTIQIQTFGHRSFYKTPHFADHSASLASTVSLVEPVNDEGGSYLNLAARDILLLQV